MADRAETAKKRKRVTEGTPSSSKRVAIDDNRNGGVSLNEGDSWAPIIASTPGVSIPNSVTLKPYIKRRGNASQGLGHSGSIATTELLLHATEHPKLDYTAREEDAGGAAALLKHYVGVYDPNTGKLEIMEARKMVVRSIVREHEAPAEDEVSSDTKNLRNILGQTFGTKKARKAIASVTENAISPLKSTRTSGDNGPILDSSATAVLALMEEHTTGMATRDELREAANASRPRPKRNPTATDIEDVYTSESLIGTDMMKHIPVSQWQIALKKKKEFPVSSRFVSQRLRKVVDSVEKLKILKYMLLLLDVYKMARPARGGRILPKRNELKTILGDMPEAVLENVKRKFSDAGVLNKFNVDLMITHLCAMACLIDNYEVDMWDLKEDLGLELRQMSQYFHEIGARIAALGESERKKLNLDKAQASQHKVAKLKLPLDFPKVSFGRKTR